MKFVIFLICCLVGIAIYPLAKDLIIPLPEPYCSRQCTGRNWKNSFPSASKREIRYFLSSITQAMLFDKSHYLKFSPEDKVFDIYLTSNNSKPSECDMSECELFADFFVIEFKIPSDVFYDSWDENTTLGTLFELAKEYKFA